MQILRQENNIAACPRQLTSQQVYKILWLQSDLLHFSSDSYNMDNPLYQLVTKLPI